MKQITLMYHDVYSKHVEESGFNTPGAIHYKISEDTFIKHIKAISNYCTYNGINKDDIVFTFDDGGTSFYTIIAPILEKYGWRGYFFISTKYIGTNGFLNVEQIKELSRRGHIIGSHSHQHRVLTEMSLSDVKNELKQSKEILSNILGESITMISIPNGCYSKGVLDIAINESLQTIYISKPTTKIQSYKGANLIGRYSIAYNTTTADVMNIITLSSLRKRMEIKYNILQLIKGILGSNYSKIKMMIRKHLIK